MPGSLTVVSPTVIASEATTKNQPPDIDIIVFQIRPGAANGTSSRQNRSHGDSRKCRRHLVEIARHRAQRLVEAERHVPGLAGEDREDRRAFGAELRCRETAPGRTTTVKVRKPSIGTDCRMSSAGMMTSSALRLLAASVADHEGEQQRRQDGREHAQRGAQRVFRQIGRIERDRGDIELGQRRAHLARAVGHQHEDAGDQDEDDEVVEIGQQAARAETQRDGADRIYPRREEPWLASRSAIVAGPNSKLGMEACGERRHRPAIGVVGGVGDELIVEAEAHVG